MLKSGWSKSEITDANFISIRACRHRNAALVVFMPVEADIIVLFCRVGPGCGIRCRWCEGQGPHADSAARVAPPVQHLWQDQSCAALHLQPRRYSGQRLLPWQLRSEKLIGHHVSLYAHFKTKQLYANDKVGTGDCVKQCCHPSPETKTVLDFCLCQEVLWLRVFCYELLSTFNRNSVSQLEPCSLVYHHDLLASVCLAPHWRR